MPTVTKHTPGTPSWVDIGSPDIAATAAFYSGLFGWTTESLGEEAGNYTMCMLGGQAVAAIGPAQNPGPPVWTTYFTVDDVEVGAKAITEAGGTVVVPPMDVLDAGRMAVAHDPTGAFFSIWQPLAHIGAQLVNEPGALCWNELNTRDVDTAIAFYERVFGYTTKRSPEYNEFALAGESAGAACMPMPAAVPAEVPNHWLVYFAVDDCDAALARARDLGATTMDPIDIPDVGRFGIVIDPLGAAFAVIKLTNPS